MKGHITKRSDRSWTIVVDTGKDPVTRKRRQLWHTIKGTKRDAQRALNEILVSMEKGVYVKPDKATVGDWLTQWMKSYVVTHTTLRTQESYESIVNKHLIPGLGNIPLFELKPQQLQSYYGKKLIQGRSNGKGGLSARSVLYHHRILSEALRHAVRMGILVRNVAELVDPPRPEKVIMATLSPEEIVKFLDAAQKTSYYVFFSTLLCTGLRRGELLALRWRNLDLEHACLQVVETAFKLGDGRYIIKEPKTPHSRRSVSLPYSLVELLKVYRSDQFENRKQLGVSMIEDDFVFTRLDAQPLTPNAVTLSFRQIIRKAGLKHLRVHDLRHTHASLMLKAGVHPKVVSERLGHATIAITLDTYSHVLPGLQEAAVEKFDQLLASGTSNSDANVSKMLAKGQKTADKSEISGEIETEPFGARTRHHLIKSQVVKICNFDGFPKLESAGKLFSF